MFYSRGHLNWNGTIFEIIQYTCTYGTGHEKFTFMVTLSNHFKITLNVFYYHFTSFYNDRHYE